VVAIEDITKKILQGIYGHSLAAIGISEPQHRGSLHTHLLLLGNLPPQLLESIAEYKDLVEHVAAVLDSMYSAQVPCSNHVQHLIEEAMKDNASHNEIDFFV